MSHLVVSDIIKQNNDAQPGWVRDSIPALNEDAMNVVDSCLALNAMPTPFAREEVVAQAFDIVVKKGFKNAGFSYKKLVSDTLDIFEILFRYNLYKDRISIKCARLRDLNYSRCNDCYQEKNVNARSQANDANRVSYFQNVILDAGHNDKIYFVVLDGTRVLAATSDKTIFYTTSRLDINKGVRDYDTNAERFELKRVNGDGVFFGQEPVSLPSRENDFFDFMRVFFEENRRVLASTPLGTYLDQVYANDAGKLPQSNGEFAVLKDSDGQDVVYPLRDGDIKIRYNAQVQINELILSEVVSLRYNINKDRFVIMNDAPNQLLPINMTALARSGQFVFNDGDLVRKPAKVEVKLKDEAVRVDDLDKTSILKFDLGVYPFFKYDKSFIDSNFDTYNIILVYKFTGSVPENAIELKFWKVDELPDGSKQLVEIPESKINDRQRVLEYSVDCRVRTEERTSGENHRTVHYTLRGTNFDYIEVIFNAPKRARGVLIPKFTQVEQDKRNEIIFAVDFGTTSTHIACNKNVRFETSEETMVFLHGNPDKDKNRHSIYKYECYMQKEDKDKIGENIKDLVDYIKNEFVPSSFGNEIYKFPMRTAVSCRIQAVSQQSDLIMFGDANIATTYEKEPPRGSNIFVPNIKWSMKRNNMTSVFIKQIVKMCVCKALQEGYSKDQIEFVKFFPLSIGGTKDVINQAWKEACSKYGISDSHIHSYTESIAPYYADKPDNGRCAVSIDIGGGSVDFAIFRDGTPQLASSIIFGCDILWGGGKSLSPFDKSNPIFLAFVDEMIDNVKAECDVCKALCQMLGVDSVGDKKYNDAKKRDTQYSSADIINFWLGNDLFKFADNYQIKTEYKAAFISHLYAILYHIAQVMKSKDMQLPTAIMFSGNGSNYINYLGVKLVKKIAAYAFRLAYTGDEGASAAAGVTDASLAIAGADETTLFNLDEFMKLSIKLPTDKLPGKERTAVGGIQIRKESGQDFTDPATEVYYGEMLEDHGIFANKKKSDLVGEYDRMNKPCLNEAFVQSICNNIDLMESGLRNLLVSENLEADFVYMDRDTSRTTLKDCLETNEDTSILGKSDKNIQSSLFFTPLRKLIFDIEANICERIANSK